MKTLLLSVLAATLMLAGCASNPRGTKAISRLSTVILASAAMQQDPKIRTFLAQASPTVCAAAASTNITAEQIVGDLEVISNENAVYVATINGVLAIAFAYADGPGWQAALEGVCGGLNQVLGMPQSRSGAPLRSPKYNFPHVRGRGSN